MIVAKEPLTKENILKKISSYDIFRTYSDNFIEIGKPFCSDLREDKNPSVQIAYIKGELLYTDFGGEGSYRAIDFVMRRFNLNYAEALQKINIDFKLNLGGIVAVGGSYSYNTPKIGGKPTYSEKEPAIIKIKSRKWNKADYEFWYNRYYITTETLELFKVIPISHFWINDEMFIADKCAYSYEFYWSPDKKTFFRKIYQPYSKRFKWVSNGGKVCQGEGMLPNNGKLLVVIKSLKDVITLYSLGYTAVAPTSESSFLNEKYFNKQKERFNNIILWYDNDKTGIKKAKEFSNLYNIPYVHIPVELLNEGIKDISDYVEKYGVDKAKLLCQGFLGSLR